MNKVKNQGKSQLDFAKVNADIREKENSIQGKKPAFIKAKEKAAHLNKKIEGAKKSLDQANKAYESHKTDRKELENELNTVEKRKEDYEEMTVILKETHEVDFNVMMLC